MGENYQYFDVDKIQASFNFTSAILNKGKALWKEGVIKITGIEEGYTDGQDDMTGEVTAHVTHNGSEFDITMAFTKDNAFYTECECPECRRSYYGWYGRKNRCAYMAALMPELKKYLLENPIGDATNRVAASLLYSFQARHAMQVMADVHANEESLHIIPRLRMQEERLSVSFKIGSDKLFVIKNLSEFCMHVQNAGTAVFGSNTKMNLQFSNLDIKARKWYEFIKRVMQDEEQFEERTDSRNNAKKSTIELYGWRLDSFFEVLGADTVEYEDKYSEKKKVNLRCRDKNPAIEMHIHRIDMGRWGGFHGIEVSCQMPPFFHGADTLYFIDKQYLCRAQKEAVEPILPLIEHAEYGNLTFQIGRNHLQEFYYSVLPRLREVVTVTEEDTEEIKSYLPPQVEFAFYLDAREQNIYCKVQARYGDSAVSVLDVLRSEDGALPQNFRMESKEQEILYLTRQFFPVIDLENDELHCNGEEELVYDFLDHGIEKLAILGEVHCTQSFRGRHIIRKPKVSLGVSVSGGLLDLQVDAEGIDRAELLAMLQSYRQRKKYYRMKNGDFVNLQDNSLQMLGELMETMHLSPKDFGKGELQLPVYRTLYLDRLLEESQNVYTSRDHTFREMVKSFKAVGDALYEEPASLKGIMRSYQKKGYKWFRTLENYGFGGILADDMGLGKTLQMISVILAAKEEGLAEPSLVVCPASLVYNWGEEFKRFAPALKVQLITGNQEERREKLLSYQDYDVLVTSYDLLKRDIEQYEDKKFHYQVIDEAQFIKNHSTAASKAVKVIHSKVRFALTGTPIENRLSELWSIFDYLMPGFLYSYEVFRREFEAPIVRLEDEDAMKRLQKMAGPFILRRLKSNVLKDLPDKLEETRYVKLDSEQQKLYDAQVVHMQTQLALQKAQDFNKNRFQILAELTRLRQICCDPSLCYENYKGESAKLEACLDLVQSAIDGGHKILLFSQYTSMLEILQRKLSEQEISFYTITGETPKEKRLQLVKAFNEDDTKVFLISLKAGGVGLNLTGADVVIHYDPWWNLAVQNQATDRAHRIGQEKKVTVYKMIVSGSIEEKIEKLQNTKQHLAEQVMSGDAGSLSGMTREELLELLEC